MHRIGTAIVDETNNEQYTFYHPLNLTDPGIYDFRFYFYPHRINRTILPHISLAGSQRHHDRWGCTYCESGKSCIQNVGTSCPCDWHGKQHQVELRAAECSVRQKAMKLLNFPPKKVCNSHADNICYCGFNVH